MTAGLIGTCLLMTQSISAQPANDSCSAAIEVFLNQIDSFTTIGATSSGPFHPNAPCPSSASDSIFSDIWFYHVATVTGDLLWSLCGMADFDSRIAVYQGDADCPLEDGDLLACNEDGPAACTNFESELRFEVEKGKRYLMRLGGFGAEEPGAQGSGAFTLMIAPPAPDNDDCEDAFVITLGEDQPVDNLNATTDGPAHPDDLVCFGFGDDQVQRDIWYRFTSPITGTVEWATCDQVTFDSRLVVYGPNVGCYPTPDDMLACSDATPGCANFTNILQFDVEEGVEYLMRLGGYNGQMGNGMFDLVEIVPPTPPANDACANADSAYIISREAADNLDDGIQGTTNFSTPTMGLVPACTNNPAGEYPDVWYHFNTLGNTEIEIRMLSLNPSAGFFFELFMNCAGDTLPVSSCFLLDPDDDGTLKIDTVSGLPPEPTELILHISSWIFWDTGDFICQLVGDITTSSAQIPFPGSTTIYPNPAHTSATVVLDLLRNTEVRIVLTNHLGQVINEHMVQASQGHGTYRIDLSGLAEGMYFVALEADGARETHRLVKQ